jgi:rhodanese-related sulfurtransferase
MPSPVAETPAAPPAEAARHFLNLLACETDCWDVHASLAAGARDFVLVDVRGRSAYEKGHAEGAVNIPHREMTRERMSAFPADTLFVVYCAGPHCNGADKAGLRLAGLGLKVKKMIGGVTGWLDEGFSLKAGTGA